MASRQGVASMFAMALLLGSLHPSSHKEVLIPRSLHVTNRCADTVWVAISSGAGSAAPALDSTGIELAPGESRAVAVPPVWTGRLWGRTDDCGSEASCHDYAAPVTVAELSINESRAIDYYTISLVDGYNLPILVEPRAQGAAGPGGSCRPAACVLDLNSSECPAELRVMSAAGTGAAVACKSACLAFGAPRYCCAGAYGSADTCRPSAYSDLFKRACPQAITYAYDADAGSLFTCRAGETAIYAITFCPASTTSSGPGTAGGNQPTPYAGDGQEGGTPGSEHTSLVVAVLGVVAAVLSVLGAILGVWKSCFS